MLAGLKMQHYEVQEKSQEQDGNKIITPIRKQPNRKRRKTSSQRIKINGYEVRINSVRSERHGLKILPAATVHVGYRNN